MEPQDIQLLVVDDNESNRDIISRQLRRRGYGVITAEDGESALATVSSQQVDLIILDIMMPGIDGLEVLRRLRQKHSAAELPIIMASAKSDSPDIVKSAELGANDHVGKPLDFAIVLAKVQALLRLKASAVAQPSAGSEPSLGELKPGVMMAGNKYRLDEKIGTGTFGAVFKARHLELDLDVAIKVLQPSVTSNDNSLQRFRQEGVAACRVQHPNAVTIYDGGVTEAGVAFLVMELLQGESLAQVLEVSQCLSPQRANEILQPVCDVLAEVHAQDLVHRDIKPENIFLHRSNRGEVVKVLDFGIAKLVGEAAIRENLTAEGWILGTPAYIAPERLSSRGYDGKADVYSLGIMLFELLTGKRPFDAPKDDPMALITLHVYEEPATLRSIQPDLASDLEEPIARALSKDPADRPDALELANSFAKAVARCAPASEEGSQQAGGRISEQATTKTLSIEHVEQREKPRLLGNLFKRLKGSD
ncbi:MAG: protein kinase [Acidobacteriota bacterium]